MDSTTLPAPSLAATPPATSPKPTKPSTPAKKQPITLEIVVQRWTEAHGRSVESALRLGWLAHRFLLHRLRSASDAGERRRMRAAAIHEIESRLHAAGLRGDSLDVGYHVRCAACYDLLRDDCTAIPAWRALRALSPLVNRNPANDTWSCPAGRIEKARGLFRRAAEKRLQVDQIVSEVRAIIGRQAKPRKHPTAFDRALAAIGRLDSLAYLQQAQAAIEKKVAQMRANQPRAAA